jgi:quinoprotein glucose dehydrogenase
MYWPGDNAHPPRIMIGAGDWIYALDPQTGKSLQGFGENGRAFLPTGATVSGAVYKNVFVTSGLFGDVYGFDVRDGRQLWRFKSVAQEGEIGGETWDKPQQGANGWGGLSVDEARGIAFVSLGAPRPDMVGVGRLGVGRRVSCHWRCCLGWGLPGLGIVWVGQRC